jgi:hydroxypyruvate reductase
VTARALESLRGSLQRERRIRAVAAGKAAVGMAQALDEVAGDRLAGGVMTAGAAGWRHDGWRLFAATHPQPSAESEAAGRAALAVADAARGDNGLLVVCLSGGASAMLAVPAPGLTMSDKTAVTRRLLLAGLDIGALNLVRRHLSAIKGGQLAARAGRSVTFAISDVCTPVEDDPSVIGSGPTVADDSTFADALSLLARQGLVDELPPAVIRHLEAGAAGTVTGPVPSADPRLGQSAYQIVASRHDAMRAASATARALGYAVHVEQPPTVGEAREAAREFLELARDRPRPACVIASGETTVRVVGRGQGGRNQEFAVAALEALSRLEPAALASVGTDGRDGPTDAAGAIVDHTTWPALGAAARERAAAALAENDAYPFLDALGALVRTGGTGTNVGDLQVLLLK